jgi:nitroreductase
MNAEQLAELLRSRRSVRDFKSDPIPEELLRKVLEDANWSPSWCNTHPYFLTIASGPAKDRIKVKLCELYDTITQAQTSWLGLAGVALTRKGLPDGDFNNIFKYPDELDVHRKACGYGLYSLLGIDKSDHKGRDLQMRKNFEFFGAPTVIFIFVHAHMKEYSVLDAGIFLQSLLLSAEANGLATCAQGALATWGSPIREEFGSAIPRGYKLLCGLSIGYASDHVVNKFNPGRPDLRFAMKND